MDAKLIAWARAVKARQRKAGGPDLPVLWLFTDARRLPDPRRAAARLPCGLAGVVFRHDGALDRAALGRDLARICRDRRLALVVAGDPGLARGLRAGEHLRDGRRGRPGRAQRSRLITSSAHGRNDLVRTRRAGAQIVFLSPVFATASHPDTPNLGALRWAALARAARMPVHALGGIDGRSVRRLPGTLCAGAGAIGAFS